MNIERQIKTIPVDANLPAEIQKLIAEGWKVADDIPPVALYHLTREVKPANEAGVRIEMHIDETKIKIMRADGTLE